MPLLPPYFQADASIPGDGYMSAMLYPPSQSINLSIEAISGITGSVSIACWLVVFTPQIVENFKRGSAEGLSLTFLVLWLLGDIFNVLGGILQGVIPTMLILAIYYTFADIVLLIQCLYYRSYNRKKASSSKQQTDSIRQTARPSAAELEEPTEEAPLLSRNISDFYGHERRNSLRILADTAYHLSPANPLHDRPASPAGSITNPHRNGSAVYDATSSLHLAQEAGIAVRPHQHNGADDESNTKSTAATKNKTSLWKSISRDLIAVSLVIFAGVAGWYLTPSTPYHAPDENSGNPHIPEKHPLEFSFYGQVFGYLCAVLYLGSRIPQIILNYKRKSCEGVAFLFFLFACLGNVTYVISIVAYRPGKVEDGEGYWRYIAVNASWLLGSFGTLGLDFVIFVQFFLYREDLYDVSESAIMSDDEET